METDRSYFKKATTAREVTRYAQEKGLLVSRRGRSGHGVLISSPDGSRSVHLGNHGSRVGLPNGTRHFLLKFIETYGI